MSALLGLCDAEIGGDGIADCCTTKIGGLPDWMSSSAEWPKCKLCQQCCIFIVQIYCPIGSSRFHRTLYVFACGNKSCWNKSESWLVIRCQLLDEEEKHVSEPPKKEESIDWGCDADDWAVDDWVDGPEEKVLSSQLDKMALTSSSGDMENKIASIDPATADVCPKSFNDVAAAPTLQNISAEVQNNVIIPLYVAVIEESFDKEDSPYDHESRLMKEYAKQEGIDLKSLLDNDSMDTGGGQEKYEKSEVRHGDAIFQKFKKRIQQCPQQILRYEFGGQALHMKKPIVDSIPPCEHCGQPRIYELQLMPALVSQLHFTNRSDEVVEFGTVQIYSCKESCWGSQSFRNEYLIVEDDPDQHLFR